MKIVFQLLVGMNDLPKHMIITDKETVYISLVGISLTANHGLEGILLWNGKEVKIIWRIENGKDLDTRS